MNPTKLLLTVATGAALAACAPNPPAAAPAPAAQDSGRMAAVLGGLRPRVDIAGRPVRWTLEERMAHHKVPGISIAVIHGGRIAWAHAAGVREVGKPDPVTTATLFQAASISKPVAATAMLRLVERGTLDLDTDVNHYLTSWRVPENRLTTAEKVTLRRIVSHNAGLTVHGFRGYAPGEPVPTTIQVLNGSAPANSRPVVVDTLPGMIGRYSGGGFTVMQQLMEDATGTPFAALMQRLVLEPAGMTHSTYQQPLPASRMDEAARGHNGAGVLVPGGFHVYPEQAAAGLWTTATDLAKWAVAISDAYAGRSTALLSREMARQMLTTQKDGFGLGVQLGGRDAGFSFSHGGSNVGFKGFVRLFPESGSGVVILTNGDAGPRLAGELMNAIAAEYGWPAMQPERVTPVTVDAAALAGLAGAYIVNAAGGGPRVEVRLEGGSLVLHGPQNLVQELVPVSDSRFVTETGWRVEFTRDASGRAAAIKVFTPSGDPAEGTRVP